MSTMQVAVYPVDTERTLGIGDFVVSFILLSKEKGLRCKATSTGAVIEGEKDTLLEILDELDSSSFSRLAKKVAITLKFDESFDKPLRESEIELLDGEIGKLTAITKNMRKKRALHDMVMNRLGAYVGEEKEVLV